MAHRKTTGRISNGEFGATAPGNESLYPDGGPRSRFEKLGWHGDGSGTNGAAGEQLARMPGIVQDASGDLHFAEWNCRAGQNNVVVRTDGTVAPCFPMYSSPFDWGNLDEAKFDAQQLGTMKKSCQQHCFSTLNHNLAYCYNDARVIKFVWTQMVKNRMKGGARSFDS